MGGPARNGKPGSHGKYGNAGNHRIDGVAQPRQKIKEHWRGNHPELRTDVGESTEYIENTCADPLKGPARQIRITDLAKGLGVTPSAIKHLQEYKTSPGCVSRVTAIRELERRIEGMRTSELYPDENGDLTWAAKEEPDIYQQARFSDAPLIVTHGAPTQEQIAQAEFAAGYYELYTELTEQDGLDDAEAFSRIAAEHPEEFEEFKLNRPIAEEA